MNFFCTKNHYEQWLVTAGANPDVFGLPLVDAMAVSHALFA
jgi:hypothetical protein